jgi:23S rRNA (guanosine2251-2'-O)-methyltransferase
MTLHLRNPHSVLAALETRPKDVLKIISPPGALDREGSPKDAWANVIATARAKNIPVVAGSRESAPKGSHGRSPQPGRHGGKQEERPEGGRVSVAEAELRERQGLSAEELFEGARDRAGGKGLWLALDSLTDPHNVGAIFRTASFFGVQGILLTQERSAPLSAAAYDVASGGIEYVPFALQTNLQRAFEVAKEAGLWILGTSEHAKQSFREVQRDRPWLLVLGNEERGMRRLTEESCDVVCGVPPRGGVTSLNVSVAAGVLISALS